MESYLKDVEVQKFEKNNDDYLTQVIFDVYIRRSNDKLGFFNGVYSLTMQCNRGFGLKNNSIKVHMHRKIQL